MPNWPCKISYLGLLFTTGRETDTAKGQFIPSIYSCCKEGGLSYLPKVPAFSRHLQPFIQVLPDYSCCNFLELFAKWILSVLYICFRFPFAARN